MRVGNYFFDLLKCFLDAGKFTHPVTGPAHTVTNTWEANRDVLLTKGNSRNIDASDISSIGYTVNAIGQRTNATRSGAATNSTAWAYDNLGQLVQADDSTATSDRAYQYDSIGNREKTAAGTLELPNDPNYAANALNQYTTIPQAAATPVYDFDGNMTSGPLPVSPTTNSTLVWDAENRLVEIKNGATTLAAYSYDALSRRIAKIPASGSATLYLYDGFNCIAEYTGTTLAKTYLWGMDLSGSMQGAGGVGGLLAENHHAGPTTSTFYPCYDGNGNITEYLNSNGISAAHFEYDPFGNTVVNTGSVELFNYRFSTKPLDFETGLYYYNYRYYDPLTGRWPSRDPIGERGGKNLYGFVGNDGVDRWDRLGLASGCCKLPDGQQGPPQPYDTSTQCCVKGSVIDKSKKETVKICFRPADLPGGGIANAVAGKEHSWAKTSQTETGQGIAGGAVPGQPGGGSGYPGVPTTMNDHTGQSNAENTICVEVEVNKCCFEKKIQEGTNTGRWCPYANDCGTVMKDAVNGCGGNWDDVYNDYLRKNQTYQDYWNGVGEGLLNQSRDPGMWMQ